MKKISTTTLRKLEKDLLKDNSKIIMFNGVELEINNFIPIQDKSIFIELVKENSFDDDIYNPLFQALAFDVFLVKYYTNINITNDLFEMYNIINSTGIIDIIKEKMPSKELEFLQIQCDKAVNYKKEQINNKNTLIETIKTFLKGIDGNLPEMIEGIKNFSPENFAYLNDIMKQNNINQETSEESGV